MSSATESRVTTQVSRARHWGRRCRGWCGSAWPAVTSSCCSSAASATPWSSSSASRSSCCSSSARCSTTRSHPACRFRQYFTAGMIASGLMITSFQSLAIQIAIERDDGTLHRLAGTPMPKGAYFLGKIILVVATAAVADDAAAGDGRPCSSGSTCRATRPAGSTFAWLSVLGRATFTLLASRRPGCPRSGRSASAVISPIVIVAPVHLRRVLRVQRAAALDAADRGAVPAEVADPGHALGVPARLVRRPGAGRLLGARQDRARTHGLGRRGGVLPCERSAGTVEGARAGDREQR